VKLTQQERNSHKYIESNYLLVDILVSRFTNKRGIFERQAFSEYDSRLCRGSRSYFLLACQSRAELRFLDDSESRTYRANFLAGRATNSRAAFLRHPDFLGIAAAFEGELGVTDIDFSEDDVPFTAMLTFSDTYAPAAANSPGFSHANISAYVSANFSAPFKGASLGDFHATPDDDSAEGEFVAAFCRLGEADVGDRLQR